MLLLIKVPIKENWTEEIQEIIAPVVAYQENHAFKIWHFHNFPISLKNHNNYPLIASLTKTRSGEFILFIKIVDGGEENIGFTQFRNIEVKEVDNFTSIY
ncbi:hypothetical protein [Anabaena azotica]|uniref:Uncharacterized protein n=1 Tax=Anabaena azotica FACHB-119 TaxID=947527 RepID=A0ABR8D9N7_9NOST|nr:hypothetical protein [Anabaena azotica]MBD2503920.1 hypothetical protein [Anabaena azotica FACHB-119]